MRPITLALSFNDVLLVPQLSPIKSRTEIDLTTKIAPDIELGIPLISVGMDTVTGVDMAVAMHNLGGISFIPRFDAPEIQANNISEIKKKGARSIGSLGIKDDVFDRAELLLKAGAAALTIDIAHAHTTRTLEIVSKMKNKYPKISLIAGTIATYEGAFDLFTAGADTVRIGVGAGTICTTRLVAGSGVPQITAIMEASRAKKKFKNKHVIADGGATKAGDIVKGLACGASASSCGSLFAGTDEAPGNIITINGVFYKEYNGSTSKQEKVRQVEKNNKDKKPHYTIHVEGVEAMVKYKGPVKDVVYGLVAGIRSGLSYSGARNIAELWKKAQFVQITSAGFAESGVHDVIPRG